MHLFSFGKLFTDLFLLLYLLVFRNGIKKRGQGKEGEGKIQSVKYESIELCCSQRTKNHHKLKLPSEIVNPNIKLLHVWG